MALKQKTILFLIAMGFSAAGFTQTYPEGLSFVGLDHDQWDIFATQSGQPIKMGDRKDSFVNE